MKLTQYEKYIQSLGWHIDLFSTFLSRKHSYHAMICNRWWVKTKKDVENA